MLGTLPLSTPHLSYAVPLASVTAIICAVIPDVSLAYAEDINGNRYAINAKTPGVPWYDLVEGRQVVLKVSESPVRVLNVSLGSE